MARAAKLTKFGKAVLAGVSIFIIILSALLLYISLALDNTSDSLIKAKKELALGNRDAACNIYLSIIARDNSCEEAYRALASIAKERLNYKDAAYFWLAASNLNPLDDELKREYFRAVAVSGEDGRLEYAYESFADKSFLGDLEKFYAAKSYIKSGKPQNAAAIKGEIESEAYAVLISAFSSLKKGDLHEAEKAFGKALSLAKTEDEKGNARSGTAICRLLAGDAEKAAAAAAEIPPENMMLADEKLSVEIGIAELQNDGKTALEKLFRQAELKRLDIRALMRCAKAAFEQKDKAMISRLKTLHLASDKNSAELLYFLEAMEFAIDRQFEKAAESLTNSDRFAKTPTGRLLEIKIMDSLQMPQNVMKLAPYFAANKSRFSASEKAEVAEILSKALNQNRSDETLIESILAIEPAHPFANILNMQIAFQKNDFESALQSAKITLERFGYSEAAFNIACASALNLKDFRLAAGLSEKRLKEDPESGNALIFSARTAAALGEIEKARKQYLKILNDKDAFDFIKEEAASFFMANDFEGDFLDLASKMESSGSKQDAILSLRLQAEMAREKGDLEESVKILQRAAAADPLSEIARWELASAHKKRGEISKAIDSMRELASNAKTPSARFRLAVLLRDGGKDQMKESAEIFSALAAEFPEESNVYMELSKTLKKMRDFEGSLAAAKKAAQISPSNMDAAANYAEMLIEGGKFDAAIPVLESAWQIRKTDKIKAMLSGALISYSNQESAPLEERISALEKARAINPRDEEIGRGIKKLEKARKP